MPLLALSIKLDVHRFVIPAGKIGSRSGWNYIQSRCCVSCLTNPTSLNRAVCIRTPYSVAIWLQLTLVITDREIAKIQSTL
jgi:hypothetical protein